jgi:hypothetical protein
MLPGIRGRELSKTEPLTCVVIPVHLLEEHVAVRQAEQSMEEVPVVAGAIAPTSGGLWFLPFNRQVQVIGNVLDYIIPSAVRVDVPPVPADGQGERKQQRGDLLIGVHRGVCRDRKRPRPLGNWFRAS